jgi:predicted transcriptional regulator
VSADNNNINSISDEVVFLAIRIPKSMKRKLQQVALDEQASVQSLVRSAIEHELDRRAPQPAPGRRR